MFHAEMFHAVLQRSAYAMVPGRRFARRYKIGDIADHKNIPGLTAQQQCRINAGIAAGHDQNLGVLPLAQIGKQPVFTTKIRLLKMSEPGQKTDDVLHDKASRLTRLNADAGYTPDPLTRVPPVLRSCVIKNASVNRSQPPPYASASFTK